jgi:uncharacterized protein (TIGR02466 family)
MSLPSFFATSIYHAPLSPNKASVKKLNSQLLEEIFALAEDDNAGNEWSDKNYPNGFTSYASANRMHKQSPTFAELEIQIRRHVMKYVSGLKLNLKPGALEMTTCWVNIMGPNAAHSLHIHPQAVISGTYYVQMPKNCSALRFEDPRYAHFMSRPPVKVEAPEKYQTHVSLPAQPGELILFESWLRHEVPLNTSQEPRISISFNY